MGGGEKSASNRKSIKNKNELNLGLFSLKVDYLSSSKNQELLKEYPTLL